MARFSWLRRLLTRRACRPIRRARHELALELLEDRCMPSVTIQPEPATGTPGGSGSLLQFRKGPAGYISASGDSLAAGDALFALPLADVKVIAAATDLGGAINYMDSGGGNDLPNPRDIGIPPLTANKTTAGGSGGNTGTFNPGAEDDEFAMMARGFIFIPSAGPWTFAVKSDDSVRLVMGANNAVVTEYDGPRNGPDYTNNQGGSAGQPGTIDSVAIVPTPGYYR